MDILGSLGTGWAHLAISLCPQIKTYLIRAAVGLVCAFLAAEALVRPAADRNIPTLMGQLIAGMAGIVAALVIPFGWIVSTSPNLQVALVTISIFIVLAVPHFLSSHLVRTYGRQRLAERILYGLLAFGFLVQLALWGGR